MNSVLLSEANLGDLQGLISADHGRGEVWLIQPMQVCDRVCFVFDEVEFDIHAKLVMYEVLMNAIGMEVPFSTFEVNVLRFLNDALLHPEGWAWIQV